MPEEIKATRGGKRAGAGRPEVDIDLKTVEGMRSIGATEEEIADYFGLTRRGWQLRKKKQNGLEDTIRRAKARGNISLRRRQWAIAMSDETNKAGEKVPSRAAATLAIWLGKQNLGQKDRVAEEHSGPDGAPIKTENKNTADRELLDQLLMQMQAAKTDGQS